MQRPWLKSLLKKLALGLAHEVQVNSNFMNKIESNNLN